MCVVDFNTIVKINSILKENGFNCSISSFGGCSFKGLRLNHNNDFKDIDEIKKIINDCLKAKWMKIVEDDSPDIFYVEYIKD